MTDRSPSRSVAIQFPDWAESAVRLGRGLACVAALLCALTAGAADDNWPDDLKADFSKGVEALRSGDWTTAEALFTSMLGGGGELAVVNHNLGIALQGQDRHEEAAQQFRKASRLDQDSLPPRLLLGKSLLALGRVAESIDVLEEAIPLAGGESTLRTLLASAYERAGDHLGMTDQYRELSLQVPDEPEHAYRLGQAYSSLAGWCIRRMQQIAPQSARLFQALGESELAQGNLEAAESLLRRATTLDPIQPGVHWSLAQVLLKQGKRDEAVEALDRELQVVPESRAALSLRRNLSNSSP